MKSKDYQHLSLITDRSPEKYEETVKELSGDQFRLIHAHLGISSEAGEIGDALKKHLMYGQDLDLENLKEEAGDLLWYISLLLDTIGSTFGEVMQQNVDKLKMRYPEGFTNEHAIKRLDKS